MTTDTILKILDEMANREAMEAEACLDCGSLVPSIRHQYQANGIGMAAKEIRRAMEAEAKQQEATQ